MWVDDTLADAVCPTAGLSLPQYDDVDLQLACIHVYNDWLTAFCVEDPDRIIGIAMIPNWDIEMGVAELHNIDLEAASRPSPVIADQVATVS